MVGLPEVLMMSAVVVQAVLVLVLAYGGIRLLVRHGFGRVRTERPPDKPIGI